MDSKTFEISVEEVKGKVTRRICERGPNFSSWVRFSGKGLALLVEGGETWSALKAGERFRNAWGEGERRYLLDLCSNRAGRFLFCLAWDVEGKKFLKEGVYGWGGGRSWLTSLEALVCARFKGERSLKLALWGGWFL